MVEALSRSSYTDLRSSFANIDNDNVNQGTCFADDKDNDNDNDLRSSFANNNNNDLRGSFANNDNDNDNDNGNDLRSSFANNDNDNDNNNDNINDNNNNDNNNDNNYNNDLRSSFANNDNDNINYNFIYIFDEKHQKGIPNKKECLSNNISVNKNEDLQ